MFTFFCKQSFFYLCKAERPTESLNLRYEIFGSSLPCISKLGVCTLLAFLCLYQTLDFDVEMDKHYLLICFI